MALEARVEELRKQLAKKNNFEVAVSDLASLFRDNYATANPLEQKAIYAAACRVATLLQTRYTGVGFWLAGFKLFEQAENAVTSPKEKQEMRKFAEQAKTFLQTDEEQQQNRAGPSTSFLFEGQLTTAPEPPPPFWLVAQNAAIMAQNSEAAGAPPTLQQIEAMIGNMMQGDSFPGLEEALRVTALQVPKGPPPASKDEVAKLPIVIVTEQVLKEIREDTECAVCRERFELEVEMQEMPCKHYFHPPCLKPWLDEHNSCPICRHELPTDDHEYESRKEREKEEEAARKGAANAVRDGELMYI